MDALHVYKQLSRGFAKTLPSGVTVTLRIVQVADYLRRGELPGALQSVALRLAQVAQGDEATSVTPAEVQEFKNWAVATALIEPHVTCVRELADQATLWVEELPWADREAILEATMMNIHKAVEDLAPFLPTATPSA